MSSEEVVRSGRATRVALRAVVAIVGLVASVLTVVPFADAADAVPFECSVEAADGGILLTWTDVPGAASYQYKQDVAGQGSAYRRVTGTSTLIPLADGVTASVGMSPIFEDGSTQARTPCGEASPNDGSGPTPLTCSVASADGGIEVSWNAIDGAVQYAWKLTVAGESPKYRRVNGTSAFISLPDGLVGSVSVTPVFADGSIRARSECGSAGPNDGTGSMPLTCSVSSAPSGVLIEWSTVNGAASYQYKLSVEGQGARYRRVTGTSVLVELPAGVTATVGLAPVFDDGSTMPRAACGSATSGGGNDPVPVIGTCGLSDLGGNTAQFTWTADNTDDVENLTWKIVYQFGLPGEEQAEVARSFDPTARSYDIPFGRPVGTVSGTIEIEVVDGEQISPPIQVDCGSVTLEGGNDPDPVIDTCGITDVGNGQARISWTARNTDSAQDITWQVIYEIADEEGLIEVSDTGRVFGPDVREFETLFQRPAGYTLSAVVQIDTVDNEPVRPFDTVDCGSFTFPDDPGPDPVILSCGLTDLGGDTARFSWTAENTDGLDRLTWKIVYQFSIPGESGSEVSRDFDPATRNVDITFQPNRTVTGTIEIESIEGQPVVPAIQVDCGSVTLDDGLPDPDITECTIVDAGADGFRIEWVAENVDGLDLTWNYSYGFISNGSDSRADFGVDTRSDLRSVTIPASIGSVVTEASISIDSINGVFGGPVLGCAGGLATGGTPAGSPCFNFNPGEITIDTSLIPGTASYEAVLIDGAGQIEVVPVANAGAFAVPGDPGETFDVRTRTVFDDGSRSLESECGSVTIPDDGGGDPVLIECSVSDTGTGFRVDWTADNTDGREITWRYRYQFILDGDNLAGETGREFTSDSRTSTVNVRPGTVVTELNLAIEFIDGQPVNDTALECGGTVVGGIPSGPGCDVRGQGEIDFGSSAVPGTASYEVVVINAAGDVLVIPRQFNGTVQIPGTPGETVTVRVRTVFDDGSRSLETTCGEVVISDQA